MKTIDQMTKEEKEALVQHTINELKLNGKLPHELAKEFFDKYVDSIKRAVFMPPNSPEEFKKLLDEDEQLADLAEEIGESFLAHADFLRDLSKDNKRELVKVKELVLN